MAVKLSPRNLAIAAALAISAAAVGVLSYADFAKHRQQLLAEAADWKAAGPSCQEVSKAVYEETRDVFSDREPSHSLTFDYDGIEISRASGKVYCNAVIYDGAITNDTYDVCQFPHPRKIAVRSDQGQHYYLTGENPVTLSFPKGKSTCVMAAHIDKVSHGS